ncbi:MAG: hypothetical protein AMS18_05510 [Gemmatimonas sp. SG8_17]|nr:MAG: hypothetical protein AMS18_05510 [Gemmatimonas sp. SG8_17]
MSRLRCSILAASLFVPIPGLEAQVLIDTLALRAHTYFLSHDRLVGRGTGTEGATVAALYIASQCRAFGLASVSPQYAQPIELEEVTISADTKLAATRLGRTVKFDYASDFVTYLGGGASPGPIAGPAVFVGAGNQISEARLTHVPLKGTVAVTLGVLTSIESADLLHAKGAVGIVQLMSDERTYSLHRLSLDDTGLYNADPTVKSSFGPPIPLIIAAPSLHRLLATVPLTSENQLPLGPLGWHLSLEIAAHRRSRTAENVACLLPGLDPAARDTVVAFSAHYDHLGVGPPDSSGDSIYNGFSDNAAGVAVLLAVAQAMARDSTHTLRESALFLFFVGEERGLLGSDFYVAHPLWPLDRTKAVINIDAGAPPGPPVSWRLAGVDSTGLGAAAISVARKRDWHVTTSPPRANSDYYPFVREGVPGVSVVPGPNPFEGLTADSSEALRKRWGHYHHPADEWAEVFPFGGLKRYGEYAYLIARAVDSVPLR